MPDCSGTRANPSRLNKETALDTKPPIMVTWEGNGPRRRASECYATATSDRGGVRSRRKKRKRNRPCRRKGWMRAWLREKRQGELLNATPPPESSPPGARKFYATASHLSPKSPNSEIKTGCITGTGTIINGDEDDDRKECKYHY